MRDGVTLKPRDSINDPWRKTMGLNLRSEAAKFILTAFNLDVFSDQKPGSAVSLSAGSIERRFAERFAEFLAKQPEAHYLLDHRRFISLRVPSAVADVSLCEYAADGELNKLTPLFDPRQPVDSECAEAAGAVEAVIKAFNATRTRPEISRPRELKRLLGRVPKEAVRKLAFRILGSTAVSFEGAAARGAERFRAPDFRQHRGFGTGYMAARCRYAPDGRGADLWLQCHHAGADGGPVQEMLDRLESSWGVTAAVVLPPHDRDDSGPPQICNFEGERVVGLLTDFIDFSPLTLLRRELAATLAPKVEAVPLGALFMWCLSRQPEFAGIGMNTAVDVPEDGDQPRAVDLVTVWPHRYHSRPGGFESYLQDLARQFADARLRKTATWKALTMLNSVPAVMSAAILRFNENGTREKFGTLTVSLVKGTRLVIAPLPDSAWDHGFIAVGNAGVPSENGPPVTSVSIKGDPERIRAYPAAIRRAVAECRGLC
jgi:hypothetical protein